MEWHDGRCRCRWANPKNELYIRYHDEEWGKLVRDDAKLFEMLILECFQAGLSWECILNKREAFRAAFDEFDLDKVCGYDEAKEEALRTAKGIVHNRLKIHAAVTNAGYSGKFRMNMGVLTRIPTHWTGDVVIHETGKVSSPLSDAVSADLKSVG